MLVYAATIFASAFLLFLVQPIVAKEILPWFGGSAAVWTTCLVFFQTALLAGYAYSDMAVRRLQPRAQVALHVVLLATSLALLPIIPAAHWKPAGDENPSWLILGLLAITIGLPFFLLSTTSPLVQAWFARTRAGQSPYRLFALSNLASMMALLGYPLLLEPNSTTRGQAIGWSAAYAAFVVLCALAGWRSLRAGGVTGGSRVAPSMRDETALSPTWRIQLLWCALAAMGSVLLLAVSNHITQNVAAVPLLWILPLATYLLTFILTFDSPGWYRRSLFLAIVPAMIGVMGWTLADPKLAFVLSVQITVFTLGLFVACMFCHGELVRSKPPATHLTRFYLMISIGGALGSVLVGIVAPIVLPAYFELSLALIVCAGLVFLQTRADPIVFRGLAIVAAIVALGTMAWSVQRFYAGTVLAQRNFYGVLRVLDVGEGVTRHRSLVHGTILHGSQYLTPELRRQPTTYYTATSGIGRLLESIHPRLEPLRVGVIGLGAGTLAVWGAKGDVYRFYDINPAVPAIARSEFSYLADSDATIEIALGDARLSLEREAPQRFDVLVVDAFSGDAIPVHLITREALGVYLRHMRADGVIAFHVTNRFLDLVPVVEALAHERDLHAIHVVDDAEQGFASKSDWVLVASEAKLLERPRLLEATRPIQARRDWRVWTDDFNNLLQVLR
ncbi:MAG TPA: fused MFS/spermidine synthase [Casimicrobiaceae bacterium]|nr:fused MFS/spermidine synthase [Casimicrobiaceae bacterium]